MRILLWGSRNRPWRVLIMNNPLSKNKVNPSPYAYIYRGIDVEVKRNYNFNCEYVVSSEYFVPSLGIFATTPKELKKKIDRRLDK
jgi:hypothetical protein